MRAPWHAALAITAMCAFSAVSLPAHAAPARTASTKYSTNGVLNRVAAASNSSAWAVGYTDVNYSPKILMLHWNGRAWSRVTSPSVLNGAAGQLSAITVVNAKDAWAVGSTGTLGRSHTLLLHWNGSAWSEVTSPAPVGDDAALNGVSATTSGGWAVGYYYQGGQASVDCYPLVFRLTGSKWTRVKTSLGSDSALGQVATTTTGATFAIGELASMITGLIARWNGHAWAWTQGLPTYQGLQGLATGPGGIAFAVGPNGSGSGPPVVALEWTGHTWKRVAVSAPYGSLNTVAVAPGGTPWAAGSIYPHSLIMRWNGSKWVHVISPSANDQLEGLAFSASNYGWAVGSANNSSGNPETVIVHWNGSTWS